MFRQQQQPQVPPAMPQMPQFPVPQPPAAQGVDFQKLLSVIGSQKQVQQPPVLPPAPPSQPAIAPNLAAIISQLNGQTLQASQNQAPNQAYEDPERKRMRDTGGADSSSDERSKRTRPNLPNKKHVSLAIPFNYHLMLTVCNSPRSGSFHAGIGEKGSASKAMSAHSAMILLFDSYLIPIRSEFRRTVLSRQIASQLCFFFVFHHNTSYGYTACINRTGRSAVLFSQRGSALRFAEPLQSSCIHFVYTTYRSCLI